MYLQFSDITNIDYGRVERYNNASNVIEIISNYDPTYSIGVTLRLPNNKYTRTYKTYMAEDFLTVNPDLSDYDFEGVDEVEITEEIATDNGINPQYVGEIWYKRIFLIPSTVLNIMSSLYADNLPFSLNVVKCTKFNDEDPDICDRWYKTNSEVKDLAILPTIEPDYEDINVDPSTTQEEIIALQNLVDQLLNDFNADISQIEKNKTNIGILENKASDDFFWRDGSKSAQGDWDIDGYSLDSVGKVSYRDNGRTLNTEGDTRWNNTLQVLETKYSTNVILQHGRELLLRAKNPTGSTIANGAAVYVSGAAGQSPNVEVRLATNADNNIAGKTIGLATESIVAGATGYITTYGNVGDINTSSFEVGQPIYLGVNGALTNVRPTPPTTVVRIGVVTRKNSTAGSISVDTEVFGYFEELSNVQDSGFTTGDLARKNSSGVFVPYSIDNLESQVNTLDTDLTDHYTDTDAHTNILDGPEGKANLVGGKVPASELPSYVDDVIVVDTYADLPATGESSKLYVVISDEETGNDHSTYRWASSTYILIHDQLSASEVKELYESNSDTNAFTDALKTKLVDLYNKAQFDTFFNDIDTELQRLEDVKADITLLESRITDVLSTNGLKDTLIGTYANGTNINYSLIQDYNYVLAVWVDKESTDPIEVWTTKFKPTDLTVGYATRTQVQNNPFRVGCIERLNTTDVQLTVVDQNNTIQTGFDADVILYGFQIDEWTADDITGANDWLNVDNQDEVRTDKFKLAIIDGKLAYEIKESE